MTDDDWQGETHRMSDYYEPHPRFVLEKPVVLAGQLGCGVAAIARHVSGRTGVRFEEIDRLIEHEAGSSLARLAVEEGRDRIEARSAELIRRIVTRRPFGLIVLGSAWPGEAVSQILSRETHFIHVERPLAFLRKRLPQQIERDGDWITGGLFDWTQPEADHEPLFERRRPLLSAAHGVLDAGDQHASAVAGILLDSLERVSAAESI